MKLITLDAETSGVDTDNDRIIQWYMRAKDGDKVVFEQEWILDPGVEIPREAYEVHGMSTEWLKENGRKDVSEAIDEIVRALDDHSRWGFVVCGYNHAFDLAILEAEAKRHSPGVEGLSLKSRPQTRYIDPVIFSRVFDKYKKGGHQLITVAKRNGVEIEEDRLHAADYDVEVTEKLVPIMLNRAWRELRTLRGNLTPDQFVHTLQGWQAERKREWAAGTTAYFKKQGKTEEDGSPIVVDGRFPY